MISLRELNPHEYELTSEQISHLQDLFVAINRVRQAYGKPMYVSSGVRSVDEQIRIYTVMGRTPALGSAHIKAAACDIKDVDGELWNWCMANLHLLEEAGLYLEDKHYTPTWVHFQTIAPKSGNRIFKPW